MLQTIGVELCQLVFSIMVQSILNCSTRGAWRDSYSRCTMMHFLERFFKSPVDAPQGTSTYCTKKKESAQGELSVYSFSTFKACRQCASKVINVRVSDAGKQEHTFTTKSRQIAYCSTMIQSSLQIPNTLCVNKYIKSRWLKDTQLGSGNQRKSITRVPGYDTREHL